MILDQEWKGWCAGVAEGKSVADAAAGARPGKPQLRGLQHVSCGTRLYTHLATHCYLKCDAMVTSAGFGKLQM